MRNTQDKGNIIVAVRDIKPFETILVDTPAIIGPFDDSLPECPECYREVSVSGYKVRGESESGDWFVPLVMLSVSAGAVTSPCAGRSARLDPTTPRSAPSSARPSLRSA